MAKISIEYCYECMFLGRAIEIATALLNKHAEQIESLKLIPGHDGVFTVTLNQKELYKIGENGLPPLPEELMARFEATLNGS